MHQNDVEYAQWQDMEESDWRAGALREDLLKRIDEQAKEIRAYRALADKAFKWCVAEPMLAYFPVHTVSGSDAPSEFGVPVGVLAERGIATRDAIGVAIDVAGEATKLLWLANGGQPVRLMSPRGHAGFELCRIVNDKD